MPIEIKELHIHVTVNTQPEPAIATGKQTAGKSAVESNEKDALVAECVEQVMEILNNRRER
jgi:hypothetical protein